MKILISILLLVSMSFALTTKQEEKIRIAYNVGKSIKASDGMTFENTSPSIMGQETSFGSGVVVGDKWDSTGRLKSLYDSSLGDYQIKLSTAKLTILKYPYLNKKYGYMVNKGKSTYKEYKIHHDKLLYYKKIIQSKKWNSRVQAKEKKAISTMKWAKKEFLYHHNFYKKYQKQASKDTMLINALMNNFKVSSEVGTHYLLSMYEEALKKFGPKRAYWKAVGRYNGGWSNRTYHKKVMERMKTVKKVMKRIKI